MESANAGLESMICVMGLLGRCEGNVGFAWVVEVLSGIQGVPVWCDKGSNNRSVPKR